MLLFIITREVSWLAKLCTLALAGVMQGNGSSCRQVEAFTHAMHGDLKEGVTVCFSHAAESLSFIAQDQIEWLVDRHVSDGIYCVRCCPCKRDALMRDGFKKSVKRRVHDKVNPGLRAST